MDPIERSTPVDPRRLLMGSVVNGGWRFSWQGKRCVEVARKEASVWFSPLALVFWGEGVTPLYVEIGHRSIGFVICIVSLLLLVMSALTYVFQGWRERRTADPSSYISQWSDSAGGPFIYGCSFSVMKGIWQVE